jgi:hypothetical protein
LLIHIFKQDLGCSIPFHGNLEKRAVQVRFCSCSSEQLYVICCFLLYNVDVQGLDVKKKKRVLTFDWFGSYLITLKRWIRSTNHLRNEVGSKLWNGIKDLFFCFVVTYLYFIYLFMWVFGQFARTMTNLTAHWTFCKPNKHIKHREGDRRAHVSSNPDAEERNKSLPPLGQYLKYNLIVFFVSGCSIAQDCSWW